MSYLEQLLRPAEHDLVPGEEDKDRPGTLPHVLRFRAIGSPNMLLTMNRFKIAQGKTSRDRRSFTLPFTGRRHSAILQPDSGLEVSGDRISHLSAGLPCAKSGPDTAYVSLRLHQFTTFFVSHAGMRERSAQTVDLRCPADFRKVHIIWNSGSAVMLTQKASHEVGYCGELRGTLALSGFAGP